MLTDPLLLHIAEEDQFVPKEAQALIVAALKNHPQVELYTYPGRDHAFAREGGEHYDAADAALAKDRTLGLLQEGTGLMLHDPGGRAAGGPEVLEAVDVPTPRAGARPGPGAARGDRAQLHRHLPAHRPLPDALPAVLGQEAAGVVEAVGEGVTGFKVGDRVAYTGQAGAYAEYHVVAAARARASAGRR